MARQQVLLVSRVARLSFFLFRGVLFLLGFEESSPSGTADGKEVSEFGGRVRHSFHVSKETTGKESSLRHS